MARRKDALKSPAYWVLTSIFFTGLAMVIFGFFRADPPWWACVICGVSVPVFQLLTDEKEPLW